jgi:hypothetical protein
MRDSSKLTFRSTHSKTPARRGHLTVRDHVLRRPGPPRSPTSTEPRVPTGAAAFVCWQPLTANQWLVVPGAARAEHVPLPDLGPPGAPGVFALADPEQLKRIVADAGWHNIAVTPRHTPTLVGGADTLDDAIDFLRTGSMGRTMLAGADLDTTARATAPVREALAPYADDEGLRLDAAVWLVTARP